MDPSCTKTNLFRVAWIARTRGKRNRRKAWAQLLLLWGRSDPEVTATITSTALSGNLKLWQDQLTVALCTKQHQYIMFTKCYTNDNHKIFILLTKFLFIWFEWWAGVSLLWIVVITGKIQDGGLCSQLICREINTDTVQQRWRRQSAWSELCQAQELRVGNSPLSR